MQIRSGIAFCHHESAIFLRCQAPVLSAEIARGSRKGFGLVVTQNVNTQKEIHTCGTYLGYLSLTLEQKLPVLCGELITIINEKMIDSGRPVDNKAGLVACKAMMSS